MSMKRWQILIVSKNEIWRFFPPLCNFVLLCVSVLLPGINISGFTTDAYTERNILLKDFSVYVDV